MKAGHRSDVKLPVTKTSKTKPSPAHRHEKAQQSLIFPCDRQEESRKNSHSVASLTPLSKDEEDWQIARTFHSIFFYAVHAEKKKEESSPWVLIAIRLLHNDY